MPWCSLIVLARRRCFGAKCAIPHTLLPPSAPLRCHLCSHDFAGPYFINRGSTTGLGAPTRYVKLDPSKCEGKGWDEALAASDASYSAKMHNIVCQNCHHHVGDALAEMKYGGKTSFGMVGLGAKVFLTGQFTRGGAIVTFLPSVIIAAIAFFLIYAVGSAV